MFRMLSQMWASLTVLFLALERMANAANHLAGWAEQSAASFADEAAADRQKRLAKFKAQAAATPTTKRATKRKQP